jgi:hypothetical protein
VLSAAGAPAQCPCRRCNSMVMRRVEKQAGRAIARMRHDGCGGLAAKAELLTGIEGVSSRPVRQIVLREG